MAPGFFDWAAIREKSFPDAANSLLAMSGEIDATRPTLADWLRVFPLGSTQSTTGRS